VIDSQIQNLSQTGAQASISQTSANVELPELLSILDKMVELVQSAPLPEDVQRDYSLDAEALKSELKKSKPRLSRVREILSTLGDTEGVLGLATRLAPLFATLYPIIERLLKSL
jgi:hypothetical protein